MWKEHSITKEEFDIAYDIRNGEQEHKVDEEGERNDVSVGEDLETFFSRIKNGKVSKEFLIRKNHFYFVCSVKKN